MVSKYEESTVLYPTKGACSSGYHRASLDVHGVPASDQSQGRAKRQAGRLHFGPGLYPPFQFAIKIGGALLVVAHPLGFIRAFSA